MTSKIKLPLLAPGRSPVFFRDATERSVAYNWALFKHLVEERRVIELHVTNEDKARGIDGSMRACAGAQLLYTLFGADCYPMVHLDQRNGRTRIAFTDAATGLRYQGWLDGKSTFKPEGFDGEGYWTRSGTMVILGGEVAVTDPGERKVKTQRAGERAGVTVPSNTRPTARKVERRTWVVKTRKAA